MAGGSEQKDVLVRLPRLSLLLEWEDFGEDDPAWRHVMDGHVADLIGPSGGAGCAEEGDAGGVKLELVVGILDRRQLRGTPEPRNSQKRSSGNERSRHKKEGTRGREEEEKGFGEGGFGKGFGEGGFGAK